MTAPSSTFFRPAVSTIVPVHNGARYLHQALESLRSELTPGDEIIVVDDGSTDGSAELAASWKGPVQVLKQTNAGPAAARNRALTAASGEWIAFLDADDLAMPDRLARLGPHLFGPNGADLVYGGQRRFVSPDCIPPGAPASPETDEPIACVLGAVLARRAVFDRVGVFNPELRSGEVIEWFARAQAGHLHIQEVPGAVFRRRRHANNLSADIRFRQEVLSAVRQALIGRRSRVS